MEGVGQVEGRGQADGEGLAVGEGGWRRERGGWQSTRLSRAHSGIFSSYLSSIIPVSLDFNYHTLFCC